MFMINISSNNCSTCKLATSCDCNCTTNNNCCQTPCSNPCNDPCTSCCTPQCSCYPPKCNNNCNTQSNNCCNTCEASQCNSCGQNSSCQNFNSGACSSTTNNCSSYCSPCLPSAPYVPSIPCNSNKKYCNLDEAILSICCNEYCFFLKKSNVVGVGLGYKTVSGCKTCEKCIKVYVTKKLPCCSLNPCDLIPVCYKGLKTDVVESGCIKAASLTTKIRPATGGYSISPECSTLYGSIGCLVLDSCNTIYLLGSNHVLANENNVAVNTNIIQPSKCDCGCSPCDSIACLSKFIPIKFITETDCPENCVDCAIARIKDCSMVSPLITFVGPPTGIGIPNLKDEVKKVGRSTELTTGIIESLGTTIKILFPSGRTGLFKNQIITSSMTNFGDSGALLLNKCDEALGIVCGTSSSISVYNSICDVLTALNVTLVTK